MEVLRLFPAVQQFQVKNGALNTDGRLYVYLNGTDDLAECFDADGSRIAQPVILDNNGRAPGLFVDSSKVYRLVVQDRYGNLLFTVRDMVPAGGGAGSSLGKAYDVVSLDGSIAVDKSVDAGNTTFDLGIAPSSDEFLEWIKCSEEDCGATWYPVFQDGTMETEAGQGVKVHKGRLYHFTNSFTVDPDGTGVNYDTFRVIMYCGDEEVDMREFDIDSSLNDQVLCEFSRDVVPAEDAHVYFKLAIPSTCEVSGETQCHRVYSGINAVPDTCATKQWVQETFDYNMSSKVDYSALGYNGYGQISGISGSAIAGGVDSATVSSIASSVASAYTESAFSSISSWTADFSSISSKADSSSLSAYQPVSAMSGYATEAYVDAKVGDKLDATASSLFLTGLPDDLATTGDVASAVSGKLDKSASGEFYPMTGNPSGFLTAHQSLAGLATVEYVDSSVSSKLDTSAFASASAGFQPSGNYAYSSSLSAYYPASASGAFQPSGNYQTAGDYAFNSAVSAKLDASASSSFVVNSSMSAWIPYAALDYSGTAISGIGGSSLAGIGGGDYTGIYPVNVNNTAREISVDSLPLVTDSSMTAYGSAGSSVIGVNLDIMSSKQDTLVFAYNAADQISSINGSALAGQGGTTGDYYEKSSTEIAYGTATTATRSSFSLGNASADYCSIGIGTYPTFGNTIASVGSISVGSNTAKNKSVALGRGTIASGYSFAVGDTARAMGNSIAFGWATASSRSFAMGLDVSAINDVMVFGRYNLKGDGNISTGHSAAFVIGDGKNQSARHDLMCVTRDGEITMFSSTADTVGTGIMSSIRAISASATGGVDSATVSAIASSYAESAASGKLDTTAFNSGDFYSTSNPSGFITGVDLTPYQPTSAMSGYIPTSVSSDFQQVTGMSSYALSSDVSATVDLVGTQSANWGGSALALSAGPGVKLEKVGDTLVARADRTLLWSGDIIADQIAQLSEPHTSFEMLEIHHSFEGSSVNQPVISYIHGGYANTVGDIKVIGVVGPALSLKPWESNNVYEAFGCYVTNTSATDDDQIRLRGAKVMMNGTVTEGIDNLYHCYAIYGINRTAGV